MNKDIFKGKWNQMKGGIRSKWGKLTDNDLDIIRGDGEKLIGKIQEVYGQNREYVEREVNEFVGSFNAGNIGKNTGQQPSKQYQGASRPMGTDEKQTGGQRETRPGHGESESEGDAEKRRRVS